MIIKNRAIVEDDWTVLRLNEQESAENVTVAAGKVIVPLKVWLAQRDALQQRAEIGVWFASDERPEDLKGDVQKFSVIAVDFPKFSDGRGYSTAYNLRARLGYTGELRAIGDVLRDQLFYIWALLVTSAAGRTFAPITSAPPAALVYGIHGAMLLAAILAALGILPALARPTTPTVGPQTARPV